MPACAAHSANACARAFIAISYTGMSSFSFLPAPGAFDLFLTSVLHKFVLPVAFELAAFAAVVSQLLQLQEETGKNQNEKIRLAT